MCLPGGMFQCLQIKIRRVDSIFFAQPAMPSILNCQEAFSQNVCLQTILNMCLQKITSKSSVSTHLSFTSDQDKVLREPKRARESQREPEKKFD